MKHVLAVLFALAAQPLWAAEPMSGAEFERYVQGKTLYFGLADEAYGAEEYLGNRRVRWSFLDGQCKDGFWYEEDQMICFVYEDSGEPQCWTFYEDGSKLRAVFENNPSSTVLYEARKDDDPMMCLGPEVGV